MSRLSPTKWTVERTHRHIGEMGLASLVKATMPLHYWDEAFRISVYLINRLPTPNLKGKTPIEVLFNTYPHYHTLKMFGCSCYLNIRRSNTNFNFAVECTFIGYNLNYKGYKFLDPYERFIIFRNIIFDENSFPFSKKSVTVDPNNSQHETPSSTTTSIPVAPLTTYNSASPAQNVSISEPSPTSHPPTQSFSIYSYIKYTKNCPC